MVTEPFNQALALPPVAFLWLRDCGFRGQQGEVFHLLSAFIILCRLEMPAAAPWLGQPPWGAIPHSHPANTTQSSVSRQLLIFRSAINTGTQSDVQP